MEAKGTQGGEVPSTPKGGSLIHHNPTYSQGKMRVQTLGQLPPFSQDKRTHSQGPIQNDSPRYLAGGCKAEIPSPGPSLPFEPPKGDWEACSGGHLSCQAVVARSPAPELCALL